MIARALILISLLAVPPLTVEQRDQLATASDDSPHLEEPALNALLTNVLQWEAGDETGARVPDYDALLADPAAGRGELYLIEGRFAGRARRYKLRHVGEFGDAMTEWVILIRDNPEDVAVVYFIDPDGEIEAPGTGANVRAVGRFYKVWADTDQHGKPTRYLTFVTRNPTVVGGRTPSDSITMLLMLLLVVVLGVAYFLIRRMSKPQQLTRRLSPDHDPHGMLSDPMGDDPARALQDMAEQQDEHRNTGDHHGDR